MGTTQVNKAFGKVAQVVAGHFIKTTASVFAIGTLACLMPITAKAQLVTQYSTSFDGSSGLPTGWDSYLSPTGSGFSIGQNGGSLVFARSTDSVSQNRGAALYSGDSGTIVDGLVSNGRIVLTYQIPNGANWSGIVARGQSSVFNPSGYYALINWSLLTMAIFETAPTSTGNSTGALATVAIPGTIDRGNTYQLAFDFAGTSLTASLYSASAVVGVDSALLSVSATDDSYTSGTTGAWAFLGGADRSVAYQSFAIAVPEPGTSVLGALGFSLILTIIWRRKRRISLN